VITTKQRENTRRKCYRRHANNITVTVTVKVQVRQKISDNIGRKIQELFRTFNDLNYLSTTFKALKVPSTVKDEWQLCNGKKQTAFGDRADSDRFSNREYTCSQPTGMQSATRAYATTTTELSRQDRTDHC